MVLTKVIRIAIGAAVLVAGGLLATSGSATAQPPSCALTCRAEFRAASEICRTVRNRADAEACVAALQAAREACIAACGPE